MQVHRCMDKVIRKLQLVQHNAASACIETRSKMFDNVTALLKKLLFAAGEIQDTLPEWCHDIQVPSLKGACLYLNNALSFSEPRRTLRSGSQCMLTEKTAQLKIMDRCCFEVVAPELWYSLAGVLRKYDGLGGSNKI